MELKLKVALCKVHLIHTLCTFSIFIESIKISWNIMQKNDHTCLRYIISLFLFV